MVTTSDYEPVDFTISVCAARDMNTWATSAAQQVKHLAAVSRLVIVPDRHVRAFRRCSPREFNVLPESLYDSGFREALMDAVTTAQNSERFGWYLQQFLKLSALRAVDVPGRVLVFDADTVLLRPVMFFSHDGLPQYFPSKEFHEPYFQAIDRLLGMGKAVEPSFISQCFPITAQRARDFFGEMEATRSAGYWHEPIIAATDFSEGSGFSEYETLGTFLATRFPDEVCWASETWSRDGYKYFRSPREAASAVLDSRGPAFVAFEHWSRPESRATRFRRALQAKRGLLRRRH